jgi:hypothetical protein
MLSSGYVSTRARESHLMLTLSHLSLYSHPSSHSITHSPIHSLIHSFDLQVMHAILVSTQSIESRFDVFCWSPPLDLASWADVAVRDVHEELCHTLGYQFGALDDTEVNSEINKSFENVSICTPKRKKNHEHGTAAQGQGQAAYYSTNKITNVFSDELLSPLRQRVQKQFALFGVDHRSKLAVCK